MRLVFFFLVLFVLSCSSDLSQSINSNGNGSIVFRNSGGPAMICSYDMKRYSEVVLDNPPTQITELHSLDRIMLVPEKESWSVNVEQYYDGSKLVEMERRLFDGEETSEEGSLDNLNNEFEPFRIVHDRNNNLKVYDRVGNLLLNEQAYTKSEVVPVHLVDSLSNQYDLNEINDAIEAGQTHLYVDELANFINHISAMQLQDVYIDSIAGTTNLSILGPASELKKIDASMLQELEDDQHIHILIDYEKYLVKCLLVRDLRHQLIQRTSMKYNDSNQLMQKVETTKIELPISLQAGRRITLTEIENLSITFQ